jgi:hypothetical protein
LVDKSNDGIFLRDLREKVKNWLRAKTKKQGDLAADCGVDAADLAHFLNGHRPLPNYALANLAAMLNIDLARLIVYSEYSQCQRNYAASKATSLTPTKTLGWERASETLAALLQRLPSDEPLHASTLGPSTLRDWPMAFLPIVVFVGDRREIPPQSPADLLAASASIGDLYYLPRLQLPAETEIRSDKSVVITTPESLRRILQDTNLLIIGSPAANLMARTVNPGACFSFHVAPDALAQAAEFQRILEPIQYLPGNLERYADVNSATATEREWSRRRRHMIYEFARSGILDPVDYSGLRATAIPVHLDWGVVSLCRHPWSENKVAVIAGGLHGPATAAAIRLLSKENAFADRPLGGVFRVHVPINAPWEERYRHLNPEWDTHSYTVAGYETAVSEFVSKHEKELEGQFKFWNPKDVQVLLKLLRSRAHAVSA